MNLNSREIKLLIAAGSIIAACIIYVFLAEPSLKRYSHELMLIGERQQTAAALRASVSEAWTRSPWSGTITTTSSLSA